MKARHLAAILIGTGLLIWTLVSCDIGAVSIDQRISTFQSDLNTSDRLSVYQDFHPTNTSEFNALKDPNLSGFNSAYPPPSGTNYSLAVIGKSNPSSGVVVQVTSGHISGSGLTPPGFYMLLTMATYNSNDWRIVTISDSITNGSWSPPRFY